MESTATPALPTKAPLKTFGEDVFVLHYRQGMNPHPMQKNFSFTGEFKAAIERGKNHCENMGLRFISVRPFMTNLEFEEKRNTD